MARTRHDLPSLMITALKQCWGLLRCAVSNAKWHGKEGPGFTDAPKPPPLCKTGCLNYGFEHTIGEIAVIG